MTLNSWSLCLYLPIYHTQSGKVSPQLSSKYQSTQGSRDLHKVPFFFKDRSSARKHKHSLSSLLVAEHRQGREVMRSRKALSILVTSPFTFWDISLKHHYRASGLRIKPHEEHYLSLLWGSLAHSKLNTGLWKSQNKIKKKKKKIRIYYNYHVIVREPADRGLGKLGRANYS